MDAQRRRLNGGPNITPRGHLSRCSDHPAVISWLPTNPQPAAAYSHFRKESHQHLIRHISWGSGPITFVFFTHEQDKDFLGHLSLGWSDKDGGGGVIGTGRGLVPMRVACHLCYHTVTVNFTAYYESRI